MTLLTPKRELIRPSRRALLLGAGAAIASPAVVRAGSMTLLGAGAAGVAFTPTAFNSGDKSSNLTLTNSNLTVNATANVTGIVRSAASHAAGKYYCEVTLNAWSADAVGLGLANSTESLSDFLGQTTNSLSTYNGVWVINNITLGTAGAAYGNAQVLAFAFDFDNKTAWVKNVTAAGNWNGSGLADPATNTGGVSFASVNGPWFFAAGVGNSGEQITANFGSTAFAGVVPSGFTAGF